MTRAVDAETALAWFTRPRRPPRIAAAEPLLARAARDTVRVEGESLVVWRWGQGPVALLVHGWEGAAAQFHPLIPLLLARGYQVVAPDMPAHGHSTGDRSSPAGFGRAVAALAGSLAAGGPLGEPAAVDSFIGHSVGSAAGLYAFAQGLQVRRSVHIAGPTSLRRATERFARAIGLSEPETARFQTLLSQPGGEEPEAMELERQQAGLRHPALLLHDPADSMVPFGESERLAATWPRAKLVPLAGAGHVEILDDARLLQTARGFLPPLSAAA